MGIKDERVVIALFLLWRKNEESYYQQEERVLMSQHFGKYSISSYLKLDNNEMINMIVIFSKQH